MIRSIFLPFIHPKTIQLPRFCLFSPKALFGARRLWPLQSPDLLHCTVHHSVPQCTTEDCDSGSPPNYSAWPGYPSDTIAVITLQVPSPPKNRHLRPARGKYCALNKLSRRTTPTIIQHCHEPHPADAPHINTFSLNFTSSLKQNKQNPHSKHFHNIHPISQGTSYSCEFAYSLATLCPYSDNDICVFFV